MTPNTRFWQLDARFMQYMQLKAAGLHPDAVDDYLTNMIAGWLDLDAKPLDYTEDGIAIVTISGPLYKSKSPFQSNYRSICEALDKLLSETPKAVVLKIDSPGGMVDGLSRVIEKVDALAQQTLVVAHGDGCLCSAAYRIAIAAGTIVCAADTDVGSIGTYFQLIDYSKAFADNGLKSILLTTGPFKGAGVAGEPITDEQQAFFQDYCNQTNAPFLREVQANRSLTDEQLQAASDGRFWFAGEALAMHLIDSIGRFADVLQAIRSQTQGKKDMPKATLNSGSQTADATQSTEAAASASTETAAGAVIAAVSASTETAAAAAGAAAAAPAKSLADYMQAFGDADGARMFRDGTSWDAAQTQHNAALSKQITELKGNLQDATAEIGQLKGRVAELAKAVGGENAGLNLGEPAAEKKTLSAAFRRGNKKPE